MDKVEIIVKAMNDRFGENIVAIDMRDASPMFDTFILCSASNQRLMNAIKQEIEDKLAENNYEIKQVEGFRESKWILIDAGDVICHIFEDEERNNYGLEKLWGDMPRLNIEGYIS